MGQYAAQGGGGEGLEGAGAGEAEEMRANAGERAGATLMYWAGGGGTGDAAGVRVNAGEGARGTSMYWAGEGGAGWTGER